MNPIDQHKFGPWAIITGASSGIGKEFARQLAASGLNVVLVARRLALLEQLGKQLASRYGIEYRAVSADLSEVAFLDKIASVTHGLDIGLVVSNAGAGSPSDLLSAPLDGLLGTVRLNIASHLEIARHFSPHLAERGRGGVLLVSALGAVQGLPYMANDGATKAYVHSLGEALHVEFEPIGIHVTVVLPGGVETPVIAELGLDPATMPLRPISVERCVAESLAALERNQPTLIPGRMFRIMAALTPAPAMTRMNGVMLSRAVETRRARPGKSV